MYVICLSGTLAVFYEEIERWEQPVADEYLDFNPQILEDSFNRYVSGGVEITEHMYLVFPSEALPRVKVSNDFEGRYVESDGALGSAAYDDLSALLTGLHINLHLPVSIGVIIVSAFGALLCGLIITGFLSHPSIVKDAFKLRWGSSKRLAQVDLHNRLSVWGAPFHLMIALTGAYYGLIGVVVMMFATSIEGETRGSINEQVFPSEPLLENQLATYGVARALEKVTDLSPDGKLLYMIVHDANSENRFMEFYVQQPGLLAWSENYRFDTQGNYLDTAAYTEGEAAQRVLYSVYRIHFGNFDGIIAKLLYIVLGLSLTVVSATGINIWLEKRKYRDALNLIWPGLVWGMPLALVIASAVQVLFHVHAASIFWSGMIVTLTAGLFVQDEALYKRHLQVFTAVALAVLVVLYSIKFGSYSFSQASLPVSTALVCIALSLLIMVKGIPAAAILKQIR
jgi:cytochrome b subunit of formate dehydrogenase